MAQFFINRPVFAWVLSIVIMLAGGLSIFTLPLEMYPDIAPPRVTIGSTYTGASAETVENSVTQVIEQQLKGLDNLLYMQSTSDSSGRSRTTLTFAPGADIDVAQVQVQNKLQGAMNRLPDAVKSRGVYVNKGGQDYLVTYVFTSPDPSVSQVTIGDYLTSNVVDVIARVDGVGDVTVFGTNYAMRIWMDPALLEKYALMPSDLINALNAQNVQVSAGQLGALPAVPGQMLNATVTARSKLTSVQQFKDIVLKSTPGGAVVTMADVAHVELAADNLTVRSILNGQPGAGLGIVLADGANAMKVADAVARKIAELAPYFPDGIVGFVSSDSTPFVRASIYEVAKTLIEAMLLVTLVMFVFLQNIRATLIPAIAVPVVLLGTLGVLTAAGYSINMLTMFALVLAIGLLVDDAIVVVENVERIMAEEGLSPKEATKKAMPQISGAIVGITLVLTTVFLPLAFMSGSVGVIYRQFSVAMAVSILFSALLALSFTPALCATLLKPIPKGHHASKGGFFGWFNRGFERTTQGYTRWVTGSLKRTLRMMVVFALLAGVLGWMYVRLPTSFLPEEDQGYVIANIELPSGASSNRTVEIIEQVEKYFMALPQVANIIAVQGFSFNGNGLNAAIAFVPLKDFSERKGPGDSAQAISGTAMGKLLFGLPDSMVISITPPAISSLGNASGFDLRLEDRSGVGSDALQAATQQLLQLASQSPILTGTRITGLGAGPQLKVEIDRAKAAALGVDFSEAANLISTAIGSAYVGKFTNQGWVQNIWVQAEQSARMNPDDILRLNARNANGEMVPLSSFVSLEWTRGPVQVVRYNGYESIRIGGSAAPGYSTGQAMAEMERLIAQLPAGLGYEWTGLSYQEIQAGSQSAILMGLSILVVFMVLAALYESWAIPLSVMLAVPLGMLGAVLLSSLMGKDNDVYFMVGMVTVIGLAAKNAILIVEFAKDLYASGAGLAESAIEAARLRFRPILMTSFAFILGVVPLVTATGAGAASQNAVGLGVLGGMLAATPLAVIFVPTFFVVILKLFKTKPKLLGHQAPHIPAAGESGSGDQA